MEHKLILEKIEENSKVLEKNFEKINSKLNEFNKKYDASLKICQKNIDLIVDYFMELNSTID